ncbi:MAG: DUF3601 domain-containing protein [Anaerolineales bacterium]|nr:DUF3601 domain-containing protein [Anaerolineales bacterium]
MTEKVFQHLVSGRKVRVQKEVVDDDRDVHRTGSVDRFVESGFLPDEDGLTLHLTEGRLDVYPRLRRREARQAGVIDHLEQYFYGI